MLHPINPAQPGMTFEISMLDVLAQITRQVMFVLNDPVIEIDDIQSPVRRIEKINRTKALVLGRKKLTLAHEMFTGEQPVLPTDMDHSDQVGGRLTKGAPYF